MSRRLPISVLLAQVALNTVDVLTLGMEEYLFVFKVCQEWCKRIGQHLRLAANKHRVGWCFCCDWLAAGDWVARLLLDGWQSFSLVE